LPAPKIFGGRFCAARAFGGRSAPALRRSVTPGPFGQDEAVTILVRTGLDARCGASLRIDKARAEIEAAQSHVGDRRFGAAGDGRSAGFVKLNWCEGHLPLRRRRKRKRSRRLGSDRTGRSESRYFPERNSTSSRNDERADAPRSAAVDACLHEFGVLFFVTRSSRRCRCRRSRRSGTDPPWAMSKAAVLDRLVCGNHGELRETVHAPATTWCRKSSRGPSS